jgi:hypothetical protein
MEINFPFPIADRIAFVETPLAIPISIPRLGLRLCTTSLNVRLCSIEIPPSAVIGTT